MARRTQQQELVSLFAADGMTLDPALIPTDTAVSTYALIRDETAERKAATFLLGDNLERTTQGGGIYTYTSQQGAAAFRDTGSFDAAGSLSQENAEAFCRDFCKAFSYDTPIFTLDETGSGTATAVRLWNGTPVFNAAVTFTIDQGRVLVRQRRSAAGDRRGDLLRAEAPLRLRRPDCLSADAPRLQLRGVLHHGGQSLLRAAKHHRRSHGAGSLLADRHGYGNFLCKLHFRYRPSGIKLFEFHILSGIVCFFRQSMLY